MKKNEVQIGKVYTARVTDKLVPVRIDAESRYGGWDATNLATGKKIRIKSAQRLRAEVKGHGVKPGQVADAADAVGTAVAGKHIQAATKPAPKRPACPNCGSTELDEDGDCARCREPNVATKDKRPGKAPQGPTAATKGKKTAKATVKAKPKRAATRAKQGDRKAKKPSGLDAAARVLSEAKEPMTCRQIVEVAFKKGYWKSGGATPWATIYSAMIREIAAKGKESRFKKVDRGRFALNK